MKKQALYSAKQPALYTSYLILGKFRFIGKLYAEFSHSLDKMGGCLGYGVAGRGQERCFYFLLRNINVLSEAEFSDVIGTKVLRDIG
jgi:hypothetical protein